jgi:ATP:ADP antiporter, AAA family
LLLISWLFTKLKFNRIYSKDDFVKLVFLAVSYFCLVFSYTILRSLKVSIFLSFVGKEYQPLSKILIVFFMIPSLLLYSKLIDKWKKSHLIYLIFGFCAFVCFASFFILLHPTFGVRNTTQNVYRLFGWGFDFFTDFFSAIVFSVFWGFINSICLEKFAKKNYGIIVAFARLGGLFGSLCGLFFMRFVMLPSYWLISLLVLISGIFVVFAMVSIFLIMRNVQQHFLISYSENLLEKKYGDIKKKVIDKQTGLFKGLLLILSKPYVFGIFCLVFGIEIISVVFDYQMQFLLSIYFKNEIVYMSLFMFCYTALFHILGLFFSFAATKFLTCLGVLKSLLLTPLAIMVFVSVLLIYPSLYAVAVVLAVLRALNYGFNRPVREMLYVPTVKNIRFKAKAWIDSFGKVFSKGSGALFNVGQIYFASLGLVFFIRAFALSSFCFSCFLLVVSFFIGKKYEKTVDSDEIIM